MRACRQPTMLGDVVFRYFGPPAPSWGGVLTSWTIDPVAVLIVLAAGSSYLVGARRVRRAGHRWPAGRGALFCAGLGTLLVATCGWVGVYSPVLLWAFAVHVLLLLLVTPVLLTLGRPVTLLRTAGLTAARRLPRRLRPLTNPMIGPILVPLAISVVFFSAVLPLSLQHSSVYHLVDVGLLVTGMLVAVPLAADGADLPTLAVAAAMLVGFMELLVDAVPGIVLRLRTHLLAPGYFLSLGRPWGPTPMQDQRIAGAIVWSVAELLDVPFLALLAVQLVRADRRQAQRIDHELDTRHAEQAPAGPAGRQPDLLRPWWETETGVFTGARGARLGAPGSDRETR